ncbi:MAG TPA: hypothetical protein VIK91_00825 [Nannocystis sp.]
MTGLTRGRAAACERGGGPMMREIARGPDLECVLSGRSQRARIFHCMKHALFSVLLTLTVACGGAADGKAEQAIAIAKELRANPAEAEAILKKHNLTVEQWEALMFEIAEDPALSAKFEAGLGK